MRLNVYHATRYRYRQPVSFGEHRLFLRPRDSHDLRLLSAALEISPAAVLRWYHDPFGNSVAAASFLEPADTLAIVSRLEVDHHIGPNLETMRMIVGESPSAYADLNAPDLASYLQPSTEEGFETIARWAASFGPAQPAAAALATLTEMTRAIRAAFAYETRREEGVQDAVYTLEAGTGSCRDFAVLLMDGARSFGLAARFASGYLYDHGLAEDGRAMTGAGETHAWAEVYLPQLGWVDFDPTNGSVGNANLVRVAVARHPLQVVPISGTYYGPSDAYESLSVEVRVAPPAE